MKNLIPLFILLNLPLFAQQYFYSNSLAMELSIILEIDDIEKSDTEWILEKKTTGSRTEAVLYNFGEAQKRIVRTSVLYSEYVEGLLREEISYRNDGQISEITSYDNQGDMTEKENYEYSSDGKLLSIRLNSSNEEITSLREFSLRENGSLRMISQFDESDDKPGHRESWNSYKGNLFMEERLFDSSREVVFFDENNNISTISQYAEDLLIYEEFRSYNSDGTVKVIEKVFPETAKKYVESMDESGRILTEEYYKDSRLIYIISNTYIGATLTQTEKTGSGIEEKWIYFYKDDKNIGEDYYREGALEQKKTITDAVTDSYIVELYDRGKLFMNLIYSEDVKIREEYILNGKIIRIRELGD